MTAAAAAACALLGAAAGPVLARLSERVPDRTSLRGGTWRAPDVVPITIVTAALFAATGARFGADWSLSGFLVCIACLVVITVTDLRLFLIPNRIIYPTLAATAVLLTLAAAVGHDWDALRRAGIGGVAAWLALYVLHFINPRGLAFGDVRLAAVIGAYTGWLGYDHIVLALVLGFFAAAGVGLVLIVTKLRGAKDPIPFGPFLAAGAVAAVLFGEAILDWYRG
jgi:leader peptidase (prepilin peptidase) / N-methyltransferase